MEAKSSRIKWKSMKSHHDHDKEIRNKRDKLSRKKESRESPARGRHEEASLQQMQPRQDLPYTRKRSKQSPQPVDLEDGEISDEDVEESLPICRFYLSNNCTWGSSCRFRHPGKTDMGNYVMFERVNLPLPWMLDMYGNMNSLPPATDWMDYSTKHETELESSFERSLQSFRQMMLQAGFKVGNEHGDKEQPLVEYNDLDTDPYYTQREHDELHDKEHPPMLARLQCLNYSPSGSIGSRRFHELDRQSSRSSSSSSDYSSTTNSLSSSSPTTPWLANPLKRKPYYKLKGRRLSNYSSSASDWSSYSSSTHTSELSYSSLDMDSITYYPNSKRRCKTYREPPLKNRKTIGKLSRRKRKT